MKKQLYIDLLNALILSIWLITMVWLASNYLERQREKERIEYNKKKPIYARQPFIDIGPIGFFKS